MFMYCTKIGCGEKIRHLLLTFWGQLLSKWLLLIKYNIERVVDIDQLIFFYCLVEKTFRCFIHPFLFFVSHMGGHVSLPSVLASSCNILHSMRNIITDISQEYLKALHEEGLSKLMFSEL